VEQARRQATQAAEVARRSASRAAIFGFFALVLGAVAAWFGGGVGTPHQATAALGASRRAV
jgi:ferric-dicitrate binding protein FerR (iron transport regulator)